MQPSHGCLTCGCQSQIRNVLSVDIITSRTDCYHKHVMNRVPAHDTSVQGFVLFVEVDVYFVKR